MTSETELSAFVAAQNDVYDDVLRELAAGRKETHWIWFIFPQLAGLGRSSTSARFALPTKAAARKFLDHPVLGPRLRECTKLLLASPEPDISQILGYPDDLKFRSSMTLFAAAAPEEPLFQRALDKFFRGEPDPLTIALLDKMPS
jgi:uncharacterized protein (DUF1810 family)